MITTRGFSSPYRRTVDRPHGALSWALFFLGGGDCVVAWTLVVADCAPSDSRIGLETPMRCRGHSGFPLQEESFYGRDLARVPFDSIWGVGPLRGGNGICSGGRVLLEGFSYGSPFSYRGVLTAAEHQGCNWPLRDNSSLGGFTRGNFLMAFFLGSPRPSPRAMAVTSWAGR